jgi:tetratricopeptide (TPR) repeat protein
MIPNKAELLCSRAQQAIAARDWEKAKQFYLLALEFRADTAEVHYGLATVYYQLRDLPNAAHHYMEVTRLEPTRARAFINLGVALHQMGEHEDAETALCKGLQLDSRMGEGYFLLGLVYKAKKQLDKAQLAFAEAVRCNPRLADALFELGQLHVLRNQPDQALPLFEQALRVRPNWDKLVVARQEATTLLARSPVKQSPAGAATVADGLARTVDPDTDQLLLMDLHQVAGLTEKQGEQLAKILSEQIAPLLVELSRLLVNPRSLRSDLVTCITQFESAVERTRSAGQALKDQARTLEEIATRFPPK